MKTRRQSGLATVEFALVGALFFVVLFAVVEFGRALFVWNTLTEATRRGARLAAVCPLNDPAIVNVAVFNAPNASSGESAVLNGLSTGNVTTEYLDASGNVTATAGNIRYVRVRIDNYQHTLLIPFLNTTLTAPSFETTLPSESLGALPDPTNPDGGETRCQPT
jgi:Flp pilus assembly protein TadG